MCAKLMIFGAGKSSLVKQFIEKQFLDSYYPTIERAYVKSINYKGNEYVLDIFDTAGMLYTSRILVLILIMYTI